MQVLLQTLNGFFRIDLLERKGRFGLAFKKYDPARFTEFGPTQAKPFDGVEPEYRFSFPDFVVVDLLQGREKRDGARRMPHFRGKRPCQNFAITVTYERSIVREKIKTGLSQCKRECRLTGAGFSGQQQPASIP